LKRVHATLSERVPQTSDNLGDDAGVTPIPASPRRAAVAAPSRDDAETAPARVAAVEVGR
jgi:hypothetical protein